MRTYGDAGLDLQLDAVLGDAGDELLAAGRVGAIDDLRIHGGHDGLEDALAGLVSGEVDGGGLVEAEVEVRFLGGDEGADDLVDVATRAKMRLELVGLQRDTGLDGGDAALDDETHWHTAQ